MTIAAANGVQFAAGDRVSVRGNRWVVDEATTFADCVLLSLSARDLRARPRRCKLLLPFDRPVKSTGRAKIRAVTKRRWMHCLHARLSELQRFGQLRGAAGASIDILPFQLEPAMALIAGHSSRFLLADEVGLGKTIQAGLMIAELQQRGWCDRALIVTPSGLRHQWADELQRRFDIRVKVIDAGALSTLTSSLPPDVNPWTVEPVVIASIDFIKQPEVLQGASTPVWDILIVDEAHQASAGSLRYEAARTLGASSRHVVLLTATPHSGDEAAYRALCEIGKLDSADPILLFRRTRRQADLPRMRHVHLLPVSLPPDAVDMHRVLAAYVGRLWQISAETGKPDVQLVATVLSKRAFSSASSLAASVERRLTAISGIAFPSAQWSLPFDIDSEPADEPPSALAAAFDNLDEEAAALRQLLEAARRAQIDEPKVRVLRKLLRRVREPVIVFTEYRDTLQALEAALCGVRRSALLHGGQTAQARRDAVNAFTGGAVDLLLATDAGAEGLNLQDRCRLIINLELPWNPIRLEQRIGRVDRIGQERTVHAINLFAEGTAESTVLAALLRRQEQIQASEIEIAASIINCAALPLKNVRPTVAGCTESIDLESAARTEAARIGRARGLQCAREHLVDDVIPVTIVRSPRLRSCNGALIWFVRVRIATKGGRLVEDALLPVRIEFRLDRRHYRRRSIRSLAEDLIENHGGRVVEFVSKLAEQRAGVIDSEFADRVARALRREHHVSRNTASDMTPLVQAGLFDNRALTRRQTVEDRQRQLLSECAERTALLEADAKTVPAHEPQIAFLLITC